MRPVVIIVILPLAELLVKKMDIVANAVPVQKLVELLCVYAV
jgi:hypothetical protein